MSCRSWLPNSPLTPAKVLKVEPQRSRLGLANLANLDELQERAAKFTVDQQKS
jgi:hypothetical protein